MEVIPAIDLRGGRAVQLVQGDFGRETVYADDPVAVALRWQEEGAPRIHVVDLDGAREGRVASLEIVEAIVSAVEIPVQAGGGVRGLDAAAGLRDAGFQRIIFGTAAVHDPALVKAACELLGTESVVVGVDARDGKVAVHGWADGTDVTPEDLVRAMVDVGVRRIIYTDVSADGTLEGPNLQATRGLMTVGGVSIICSGGIGSLDDLARVAETGVEGVIVGTALYNGAIGLGQAIARFGG